MSNNLDDLQKMLNVCSIYGSKWRLKFNSEKTKLMEFFTRKLRKTSPVSLNNNKVKFVDEYKYLGVIFQPSLCLPNFAAKILKKFESKVEKLRWIMAANGCLCPHTSLYLYQSLCRPILEQGAQVLPMSPITEKLEKAQMTQLKILTGMRPRTKNETVRLITGKESMRNRWKKLKFLFWNSIFELSNDELVRKIFIERKSSNDPRSAVYEMETLLSETAGVELDHIQTLTKNSLKCLLKTVLNEQEFRESLNAVEVSINESTGQPWAVCKLVKSLQTHTLSTLDILKGLEMTDRQSRNLLIQSLTGCDFSTPKLTCIFCNQEEMDALHLLTSCKELSEKRLQALQKCLEKITKLPSTQQVRTGSVMIQKQLVYEKICKDFAEEAEPDNRARAQPSPSEQQNFEAVNFGGVLSPIPEFPSQIDSEEEEKAHFSLKK